MNIRDIGQTLLALFVFASAYSLIRIALMELPPLTVAAVRFILASSLMVPLVLLHHRSSGSRIARRDLPILLGLSVFQIFMPNLLQNVGLEYTTASVSSVLQSTTPVFTLLLSFALLKENVGWREVLGVTVGMIGVTLLSTGGDLTNLAGSEVFGNILQVGVAASYAMSGIVGKTLLKKYSPIVVVTFTFVIGGSMLTGLAILFERSLWPASLSNHAIIAILLLSFLYCIGLVCWYDVLQRTGVFRLYVLLFTMPIMAILISIIVLNETFTVLDILFSIIIMVGVALTQLQTTSRT
jgi:drug/metabolite transporter (DMT)-like permease